MADHKKIKTCFAQIIVEEIAGKLYYSIMYWNGIGMHIGYSSYELENVRRWLNEEFEVNRNADVAPVVHGKWISFLDGDHIMPERYYRCSRCGRVESRRQPYCHCGAKMDGAE